MRRNTTTMLVQALALIFTVLMTFFWVFAIWSTGPTSAHAGSTAAMFGVGSVLSWLTYAFRSGAL